MSPTCSASSEVCIRGAEALPPPVQIDFQAVKMRYRPGLPLVLRGLSVRVEPRSRVGVVGRTGAGKSSLVNCMFRLMELDSGRIEIDGVDISQMGLHQLRSAMSLIPQVGFPSASARGTSNFVSRSSSRQMNQQEGLVIVTGGWRCCSSDWGFQA